MVVDNRNMTIRFGVRLLGIEANQPLLRYLSGRYAHGKKYWTENPSCSPTELGPSPALGAKPKLVEWLWTHLHAKIPSSRCWVVLGTAALVNPGSEVVFAFVAGGICALRVPPQACKALTATDENGSSYGTSSLIGNGWVEMATEHAEEWSQCAFDYSSS
jgi:hypothetical protein